MRRVSPDCLTRTGYRLPTEAEWDHACRSGTSTPRHYGYAVELLAKYAWYIQNSEEQRHPPGLLMPNDLGLFDTYGNVWEWCQDLAPVPKPSTKASIPRNVVRGGPYTARPWFLLSSWASADNSHNQLELTGFRIARTLPVFKSVQGIGQTLPGDGTHDPESTLAPCRGGALFFGAWRNQTDIRSDNVAAELNGAVGFRIARTQPR